MENYLNKNRDVWENMFEWIHSRGGHRKYPNETVVIWLLGYARTHHQHKKVLEIGSGWSQCLPLFMNEGFEYWGVDVTDKAFISADILAKYGWSDRVHLSILTPPRLDFPDEMFTHAISTEALHLNSEPESIKNIINEIYRVLKPGGRFVATVMKPDYWFITTGGATWVSDEMIEINRTHCEKERIGATYFVFKDKGHIRTYFKKFAKIYIGQESRVFGEFEGKYISHWIISVEK